MELNPDIIVVGGGASGLMAAGRAAESGARVVLLEKMGRVGIKLALTGKGRCNLTNSGDLPGFIENYQHNGKFLYNAFSRFFNTDLIRFFEARGVPTAEERGRRVFPASNRARDIVRALRDYASPPNVQTLIHAPVRALETSDGRVKGVRTEEKLWPASRVILASGGASYPETGSTGDGYRMAERAGHTIHPIRPSLVPLEVEDAYVRDLQGLALKNVKAAVYARGKRCAEEFGEMLFTHFGVSGPIILTLSAAVVDEMDRSRPELSIDFKPALSREQAEARIGRDFQANPRRQISSVMAGLLPQRLVPVFLKRTGIDPQVRAGQIRIGERERILDFLKDWRLSIKKPRPIAEAIVTAGGVDVKEINPQTMESKIIKGLFFCGEMIDIDGKTGGYNLQAAFSTGWLAGEGAAKNL